MPTCRAEATSALTGCDVRGHKVLVIGAGGIGCELVKNLVLSGFERITMVDLDTIDYSNLNRQFLFRAKHVGRSKAHVARESVLDFPHDEGIEITSKHGNVKSQEFTFEYFRSFSIVLNALDNVEARRHVNRICLSAEVPLIESGTQGYLGQVRVILKGKTQCYECDPPPPPKSYPICTIRNHPDKPVHCIHWSKELLFKKIFGGEDTDLLDATEGEAENTDDDAKERNVDASEAPAPEPLRRQAGEDAAAYSRRVFEAVFETDVRRLLSMDSLWKERAAPRPLVLSELALPNASSLSEVENRPWSIEESAAVFLETIRIVLEERSAEVGALSFDKDDVHALDFVTAASNLRSAIFDIPRQSRWDVKEIAGNIVPAIATTNAIIAGFIVLEAFKVLAERTGQCKYLVCNRHLAGRRRDLLLNSTKLDPPNPDCCICGTSEISLTLDTTKWTVEDLIDRIVKKHLSFNRPTIDYNTLSGASEQLCEGQEDSLDDDEARKYKKYLPMTLSALPIPIASGTILDVEDMTQDVRIKILVKHETLSDEDVPSGFVMSSINATNATEEDEPVTENAGNKRNREGAEALIDAKKSRE